MEFKTKLDYDNYLKGNELYFSLKRRSEGFELFTCNECFSHFDNRKERDQHLANGHDLTFDDVSSGQLGDSDFKDGGAIFETLICDMCDEKKTSEFKHLRGGFVSCSDCTKEKI